LWTSFGNFPQLCQSRPERTALTIVAALAVAKFLRAARRLSHRKHVLPNGVQLPRKDPIGHDLFEQYFCNSQGLWIRRYHWAAKAGQKVRGAVVLSHGFAEHCLRYEHIAHVLNQNGYQVYGMDHQGHGLSDGERGWVDKFADYTTDFVQFATDVKQQIGESCPMFLLGHSMGGCIAVLSALRSESLWAGVMLSGPMISADPKVVTPVAELLFKIVACVAPKLIVSKIDGNAISNDPMVVEQYRSDPLVSCFAGTMAAFVITALAATRQVQAEEVEFGLPCLVMHGKDDSLAFTMPSGSQRFFDRIHSEDKTLKLYDGMQHEILNEIDREKVANDILLWIDQRAL